MIEHKYQDGVESSVEYSGSTALSMVTLLLIASVVLSVV